MNLDVVTVRLIWTCWAFQCLYQCSSPNWKAHLPSFIRRASVRPVVVCLGLVLRKASSRSLLCSPSLPMPIFTVLIVLPLSFFCSLQSASEVLGSIFHFSYCTFQLQTSFLTSFWGFSVSLFLWPLPSFILSRLSLDFPKGLNASCRQLLEGFLHYKTFFQDGFCWLDYFILIG